jgi:cell division protein ZapA (FtsZ GTPase activity inhibitor)
LEQLVTINIFGKPYTFKSEADRYCAEAAADFLANEVKKIENQLNGETIEPQRFAILISAALNIAHEFHELKERYAELVDQLQDRTARLGQKLDDSLQSAQSTASN